MHCDCEWKIAVGNGFLRQWHIYSARPRRLYCILWVSPFLSSSYHIVSLNFLMKVKLKWVDVDEISFFVGIKRNYIPFSRGTQTQKHNMRIKRVSSTLLVFTTLLHPMLCCVYHTTINYIYNFLILSFTLSFYNFLSFFVNLYLYTCGYIFHSFGHVYFLFSFLYLIHL